MKEIVRLIVAGAADMMSPAMVLLLAGVILAIAATIAGARA